jgi:hypothetical protein
VKLFYHFHAEDTVLLAGSVEELFLRILW